jgi:hypothetical protein
MPRGRTRVRVTSLEAHVGDLTAWQLCDLVARYGLKLSTRTLHRWLQCGFVHGYHRWDDDREWRIPVESARRVIQRMRAARAA